MSFTQNPEKKNGNCQHTNNQTCPNQIFLQTVFDMSFFNRFCNQISELSGFSYRRLIVNQRIGFRQAHYNRFFVNNVSKIISAYNF